MPTITTRYWFILLLRFVPLQTLRDYVVHFLFGQFGEHGKRNASCRIMLGVAHRARDAGAFAPRVTGLLVNSDGVCVLASTPESFRNFRNASRLAASFVSMI